MFTSRKYYGTFCCRCAHWGFPRVLMISLSSVTETLTDMKHIHDQVIGLRQINHEDANMEFSQPLGSTYHSWPILAALWFSLQSFLLPHQDFADFVEPLITLLLVIVQPFTCGHYYKKEIIAYYIQSSSIQSSLRLSSFMKKHHGPTAFY